MRRVQRTSRSADSLAATATIKRSPDFQGPAMRFRSI
jgi:hypothetical protein